MLRGDVVEVPMSLGTGRPVVQVMVDGNGPYNFILDTGASATLIDSGLAAELNLPVVGETKVGDPSDPEAFTQTLVKAKTVQMGGLELWGVTLITFDVRKMMGPSYGGVLGFPHLKALLVTLDYPQGRVILTRGELQANDPEVAKYESEGCLIALPMTVAGEPVRVHLDSGNPGSFMLPNALADRWRFKSEPVEVGRAGTVSNMTTIWSAQVDGDVEVGGLTYKEPEVLLSDLIPGFANMGFDALADVVLTVDQKNSRLKMVRSEATGRKRPARRRVGVMFKGMARAADGLPFEDGGLVVDMVGPGSLAEKAGIKVGDIFLSINDRPVVDYGLEDLSVVFGGHDPVKFEIRRGGEIVNVIVE